jgi:hypothetical protein
MHGGVVDAVSVQSVEGIVPGMVASAEQQLLVLAVLEG